ncbi:MAG: hypothetical protein APR53_04880 [Methanoculleus sp. SDB]|nr:MAG: hypothetical protein APR53_04880 [Methanoculleus sp. SDB]
MLSHVRRYREIAGIMVTYGFGALVEGILPGTLRGRLSGKPSDSESLYRRIRLALEELGPTFVKFGQLMSTRRELFPPGLIDELIKLTDEVAPLPFEAVRPVIEECCGPIGETFASFDKVPFAAASLAQVHRATLPDGTAVAVKVQRPGIEEIIETDIAILGNLARRVDEIYPDLRIFNPQGMVREFSTQIRKELDFIREGNNTERLAASMADIPGIRVPRVFRDMSCRRVLTMEYISGVRIDDIAGIRGFGIATGDLSELVLQAYLTQIFEDGFFHADPHRGNLLVTPEHELVFIDCGMVGVLRPERRKIFVNLLLGMVEEDVDRIMEAYAAFGIEIRDEDLESFKDETYDIIHGYRTYEAGQLDFREMLVQIPDVMRRYHLQVPLAMMQVLKVMMIVLDNTVLLDPAFNFPARVGPYLSDIVAERYFSTGKVRKAGRTILESAEQAMEIPATLNTAFKKISKGHFKVDFAGDDVMQLGKSISHASYVTLIGMIIASLVIGSSLVVLSTEAPLGAGTCGIIRLLTLLGYAAAVFIGIVTLALVLRSRQRLP